MGKMTVVRSPKEQASDDKILAAIKACGKNRRRVMVDIAGPPGSGKSTFAAKLASRLGPHVTVLSMVLGFREETPTLQPRNSLGE